MRKGSTAASPSTPSTPTCLGGRPILSGATTGSTSQHGLSRYTITQAFLTCVPANQTTVSWAYSWFRDRAADPAGLDYWNIHVNNGLPHEYLFAFFVGSPEYWAKF